MTLAVALLVVGMTLAIINVSSARVQKTKVGNSLAGCATAFEGRCWNRYWRVMLGPQPMLTGSSGVLVPQSQYLAELGLLRHAYRILLDSPIGAPLAEIMLVYLPLKRHIMRRMYGNQEVEIRTRRSSRNNW